MRWQTLLPRLILFGFIATMIFAMGCTGDVDFTSKEDDVDDRIPVKANLAEFEAIDKAQRRAYSSGYTVSVQVPFTEPTEVPCSDAEVQADRTTYPNNPELWTCQPISPGSSSYVKGVQVGDCCESKDVQLPRKTDTSWEAEYLESSDSWRVGVEFSIDNRQQSISWVLDDDTRTVSDPQ